jgi:uncharacterized protein (TIGR02118 family)
MSCKVVTLLKRRQGIAVDAFQRDLLGPFAAGLAGRPGLQRCVLSAALVQGYARGELLFDAICEMWFADAASGATPPAADFLDASRTVVMPVDVHVIKDGAIPPDAVKNIEFVNRRPGMPVQPFQAYWRNVHGPLAATIPVLRRYEQNHLEPSVYERDPSPPYDGLAITWFESTADMKRGTTTPEYAATRADEKHFLPDGHLPIIITKEHVVLG